MPKKLDDDDKESTFSTSKTLKKYNPDNSATYNIDFSSSQCDSVRQNTEKKSSTSSCLEITKTNNFFSVLKNAGADHTSASDTLQTFDEMTIASSICIHILYEEIKNFISKQKINLHTQF